MSGVRVCAADLFCGAGGLTCGLLQAGIDVRAGFDTDPFCECPYVRGSGAAFVRKSVADVTGGEIRALWQGADVTLLAGCAPCQPFSNHQHDKRHRSGHRAWGLLFEFASLIAESGPGLVCMENVPGLERESVFSGFLAVLKKGGYHVHYATVNAALYGVPQARRRLLLIASRHGEVSLIPPDGRIRTVRGAIGDLPPVGAGESCPSDPLHVSAALSPVNLERIRRSVPGGTWRDWPESLRPACYLKKRGQTYGSVFGRMSWDEPAPTLTTQFTCYGTGRFGHPEQDRALTLREGARLQTFPDDWPFAGPGERPVLSRIARQIGNAVPPRLGEIMGLSLLRNLRS